MELCELALYFIVGTLIYMMINSASKGNLVDKTKISGGLTDYQLNTMDADEEVGI